MGQVTGKVVVMLVEAADPREVTLLQASRVKFIARACTCAETTGCATTIILMKVGIVWEFSTWYSVAALWARV